MWVDRCELCHGPTGQPGRRRPAGVNQPPDLSDSHRLQALRTDDLLQLVRHGEDGRPGDDVVEGMRRPTVIFDAPYFATHDDELLRVRVWHMVGGQKSAMPHFAPVLSDAEVRAILEYLRGPP